MMYDTEHGYILTVNEVITLFGCMGAGSLRGLALKRAEIDAEAQLEAMRSLLHKGVIVSEGEGYRMNEPFRTAIAAVIESRHAVTLVSKNYSSIAYVCYMIEDKLSVWEFNSNSDERVTLYLCGRNAFIEKLTADGFIPQISEYCRNIPENYAEDIKLSAERFLEFGDSSFPRIYMLVKQLEPDIMGTSAYYLLACGKNGSIISRLQNDEVTSFPYKKNTFERLLKRLLSDEEVRL